LVSSKRTLNEAMSGCLKSWSRPRLEHARRLGALHLAEVGELHGAADRLRDLRQPIACWGGRRAAGRRPCRLLAGRADLVDQRLSEPLHLLPERLLVARLNWKEQRADVRILGERFVLLEDDFVMAAKINTLPRE
jgi:hypothetical protein